MINTLATSNNSLQSLLHSSQTLDPRETSQYMTMNYTKSNDSPNDIDLVSIANFHELNESFDTHLDGDINIENAISKMKNFKCKWLKF